jgi:hypothetical protein
MKLIIVLFAALAFSSCSSSEKKVDESKTSPVAAPVPQVSTAEDIGAKYSIVELNSAANLLKVVVDTGKGGEDAGSDLIGCPLTAKEAGTMTMPLKALIDQQMRGDIENYQNDPKNYAVEKGFEMCGASCACGVLSDVVNGANEAALPAGSAAKLHARNKQRLAMKASHQTSRDSMACARKQSWFCGSDLKAYLEKTAKSNRD